MTRSAIVVGGGIIGLCSALALQRRGVSVTLLEPDRARRAASWGNAGHIATEQVEPLASWAMIRSVPRRLFCVGGAVALPPRDIAHWLPFSVALIGAATRFDSGCATLGSLLAQAMPAWRELDFSLNSARIFKENGHYLLWETPQTAARGIAMWSRANIGTTRFRPIDDEERATFARLLKRPPAGGIKFENSGQITDHKTLAQALERAIVDAGGHILPARAEALAIEGGAARVILESREQMSAEYVVVAAGVRSRELLATIGIHVPLIAERGYHLHVDEAEWPELPPVAFEDRSVVVTRFNSGLRMTSFVEFANPDSPPDARKWQRLRKHARELGLPFSSNATEWMGCRPTLPDYLPAIGRTRRASNLLYAFGHQHLGLTLGPITGQIIAALATESPLPVEIGNCDIERFSR
ncbi:MAG TPA: FAD-binding oxidoreductase [Steroidobacteraceae bacterium]